MKLSKLISGLGASIPCADIEITDVCYDSRKVKSGSVFVCLAGGAADGHKFAALAQDSGAVCIVAEHETDSTLPHIIVPDTRKAMFVLSSNLFGNPETKMKFIGVTGTNGKTSTAYYIKSILDRLGKKTGLIGTVTNMVGEKRLPANTTTPEPYTLMSLLSQMADEEVEYVVMEVSSHSIVQKRVFGIQFETVVFTNLTQDHLDYHGTMENYKAAKFEAFKNAKSAVLNIDDETGREFYERLTCKKYTYSTIYNKADFVAKEIKLSASGVSYLAVTIGNISKVSVSSPGAFMVNNTLSAIGAVCAVGFDFDEISPCVSKLGSVEGRAEIISEGRPYTVMIDYAHTPDGLENILKSVLEYKKGRLVTLFGCGGDRDRTKRPIMGEIASRYSDFVIVTSDNPRTEQPMSIIDDIIPGVKKHQTRCKVIEDRREAIKYAITNAKPDDLILLAGKGHENYQVIGTQKVDFNEHEIAKRFMEETEQ